MCVRSGGLWMMAIAALVLASPVFGQTSEPVCAAVETIRPGEFVYGQSGQYFTASTLRPNQEPVAVGRSVIKGAMARKLSAELDGASVRWSTALLKGPVACGDFNVFQILVNPTHVRITAP